MEKENFAFGKKNFIAVALCMAVVIVGFLLMTGSGSTEGVYNPDIFSALRVRVAPVVCLAGFVGMIYAIIKH